MTFALESTAIQRFDVFKNVLISPVMGLFDFRDIFQHFVSQIFVQEICPRVRDLNRVHSFLFVQKVGPIRELLHDVSSKEQITL